MRASIFSDESIRTIGQRLRSRELSPVDLVEESLSRINELNGTLNAYITVMADDARAAAKRAERMFMAGADLGPLHGIPISVKDIFLTAGIRTTAGSRVLANYVPTADAEIVRRLRGGGAIIVGKANTNEFASSVVHPDFGEVRNPWNTSRTAGGSSSGSAASVASLMDFGSFGTDTGGSIRLPAAFCGLAGFKPTHGVLSRDGIIERSWTLDHAGPMARSVEDAAILFEAAGGSRALGGDDRDGLMRSVGVPETRMITTSLTMALITEFMGNDVDPEVRKAVNQAAQVFASFGVRIEEVSIPELEEASRDNAHTIRLAELAYNHRDWYADRSEDYTDFERDEISRGSQIPAGEYFAALDARRHLRARMDDIHQRVDLLLLPTVSFAAPPVDTSDPSRIDDSNRQLRQIVRRTSPFNFSGQPALSVPCGFTDSGLPVGLQIVGAESRDHMVLGAGLTFQSATDWHLQHPPVV